MSAMQRSFLTLALPVSGAGSSTLPWPFEGLVPKYIVASHGLCLTAIVNEPDPQELILCACGACDSDSPQAETIQTWWVNETDTEGNFEMHAPVEGSQDRCMDVDSDESHLVVSHTAAAYGCAKMSLVKQTLEARVSGKQNFGGARCASVSQGHVGLVPSDTATESCATPWRWTPAPAPGPDPTPAPGTTTAALAPGPDPTPAPGTTTAAPAPGPDPTPAPGTTTLAPAPGPDPTPAPAGNTTTLAPTPTNTTLPPVTTPVPSAARQIQSSISSLCMDLPAGDTSNGALLWTWECYGGDTQQWSFQDGQLVYVPDPSKCVDLLGGDTTNGNRLGLWDCYQGDSQLWGFDSEWGTIYLASSAASDATKCAQIGGENKGDPLVIWDCTAEPQQVWTVGSPESSLAVV